MGYSEIKVMNAFNIYSQLSITGECYLADFEYYLIDQDVRGLVDNFCKEVDATILITGDKLLLIPIAMASPFHISNENLKNKYLPKNSLNSDIYLMYFAIISFYGMFYDSYTSTEAILEFTSMTNWLEEINEQIATLSSHDDETLEFLQRDMNYNWKIIIEKWHSIDDTNEKVKKQDGRTNSRISFLNSVKKFMMEQNLIIDLGNMEIGISDKSKDIIGKYFMDAEYNRGIIELLYKGED